MRKMDVFFTLGIVFVVMVASSGLLKTNDLVMAISTDGSGLPNPVFVGTPLCVEYREDPFTGALKEGEYQGKNVGEPVCHYVETDTIYKKMDVKLLNAYPGYIVKCKFQIQNIGGVAAYFAEIEFVDSTGTLYWDPSKGALCKNGKPMMYLDLNPPDLSGVPLKVNEIIDLYLVIEMTQNAEQNIVYSPSVVINFSDVMP